MADASDSKSGVHYGRIGSTPITDINKNDSFRVVFYFRYFLFELCCVDHYSRCVCDLATTWLFFRMNKHLASPLPFSCEV